MQIAGTIPVTLVESVREARADLILQCHYSREQRTRSMIETSVFQMRDGVPREHSQTKEPVSSMG